MCSFHSSMNIATIPQLAAMSIMLVVGPSQAQAPADKRAQPDNTGVNKGDQESGAVTADSQKMNAADQKLTANIRQAVIADKSFSTYAHNVKIISQNGTVTLKGPVRSSSESNRIAAMAAKAVQGSGRAGTVINLISVKAKD